MEIEWVSAYLTFPPSQSTPYLWLQSPGEQLKLLKQYNIGVDSEKFKDMLSAGLRRVWSKWITSPSKMQVGPCLHCELQMTALMQQTNVTFHNNLIRVSKLMHMACNLYQQWLKARQKALGVIGDVRQGSSCISYST